MELNKIKHYTFSWSVIGYNFHVPSKEELQRVFALSRMGLNDDLSTFHLTRFLHKVFNFYMP